MASQIRFAGGCLEEKPLYENRVIGGQVGASGRSQESLFAAEGREVRLERLGDMPQVLNRHVDFAALAAAKGRQKDSQARRTKRHGPTDFGYKSSASADDQYMLIRRIKVSTAAENDTCDINTTSLFLSMISLEVLCPTESSQVTPRPADSSGVLAALILGESPGQPGRGDRCPGACRAVAAVSGRRAPVRGRWRRRP